MRRLFTSLALALLALLVAAGTASATHSDGAGPGQDLTVGTGALDDPAAGVFVKLHVNAKSGPFGEDPSGHLNFKGNPPGVPPIDIQADVTCLFVSGHDAVVGFVVTKSKAGPFPEGFPGLFAIHDGGEPGTADRFEGFPGFPDQLCAVIPVGATNPPITQGNFIVHDAP
jgi:hypothetical protein